MSGFSLDWLDLREPADFAARNKDLATPLLEYLRAATDVSPIIVDLGSGSGSTLRALTAIGVGNCVWRLVDHDPALLDEALRRHSKSHIVEDYEADLLDIASLPLTGATLLSASALFDLVSVSVAETLIARLKQQGTAFYAALNYDGRTHWTPAHELDAAVLAAFNQDQTRDKGLGPAMGAYSPAGLCHTLERAGYTVLTGDSSWQLSAKDQHLVTELIRGIRAAVSDGYDLSWQALDDWEQFRLSHAGAGLCHVGHTDVLAFPGERY